ncbi:MAG: GNAT family N-acetyltransferase [Morganella sp. (in: enterobacteria)]
MTTRIMTARPVTTQPDDYPLLQTIAQVLHNEWQALPQWRTPEIILARLLDRVNGENGEQLFVATDKNGALLATASLIWRELKTSRMADADWWTGEIYTLPAARGQGLGSTLTQAVVDAATARHLPALNLYTPDKQAMYARMGWKPVFDDVINDENVTIMQRLLAD